MHQGNLRTRSGSAFCRDLLLGHALFLHRGLFLRRPGCQLGDLLGKDLHVADLVASLLAFHGSQQLLMHQRSQQEARRVDRLAPEERIQNDRRDRLLGGVIIEQGLDRCKGDPLIAEEAAAG